MQIPEAWIMAHPWMTFFIILAVIAAVENILVSFVNIFNRRRRNTTEVTILDRDGREIK